ncbi:haloalkane dehalogenase [Paenibacillus sp. J5C_2022]|uniref:haloalkane dehalogenase n=1 Tax=Paenibacillus sp. J5C2022 TaxID=2977129 RepID=UPI0021D33208|nr:haloalkane dehalogenase [Paenibacillus sp. J5C2022]MCU6711939.1 haloalkane dehalogenase [Paenibacillus sp. J5C2022]
MINAAFPYEKKRMQVSGLEMAYVDEGSGDPIVFLHGNPSSSYLWRNIIPYARKFGRCIAPDLIGMGDSAKLPDSGPQSYTFAQHRLFVDELLDQLGVSECVTFVVHDWGSVLGFDWSMRHPAAVTGIIHMEAIIKPRSWSEMPEKGRSIFQSLRTPKGEDMVLEGNSFIEFNLPVNILRKLTDEEMTQYRRPFLEPGESRRPMLSWARQLPFDGDPADVAEIVTAYGEWLAQSDVPKLFIKCEPGLLPPSHIDYCRTWPSQTEVTVPGRHYPQEDAPDEVGEAIAAWLSFHLQRLTAVHRNDLPRHRFLLQGRADHGGDIFRR